VEVGKSLSGIPDPFAYSQSEPPFESLLKKRVVEPLMKVKLRVARVLPLVRVRGVILAHAMTNFFVVPETGVELILALLNEGLKKVAGDGLNEITVESYSILRVIEPIFVKLVMVICVVKVAPGHTAELPIVVIGALSEYAWNDNKMHITTKISKKF